jgi:hypothetical protein
MRIVPIPTDLELADFQTRGTLGPPKDMTSQDCDTVDIIRSEVELPSGQRVRTVQALVFVSADELERIRGAGGHFWIEFIGHTFPPVMFVVPERSGSASDVSSAAGAGVLSTPTEPEARPPNTAENAGERDLSADDAGAARRTIKTPPYEPTGFTREEAREAVRAADDVSPADDRTPRRIAEQMRRRGWGATFTKHGSRTDGELVMLVDDVIEAKRRLDEAAGVSAVVDRSLVNALMLIRDGTYDVTGTAIHEAEGRDPATIAADALAALGDRE